jgi:hypothetical protein
MSVLFPLLLSGPICAETKIIVKGAAFPHVIFQDSLTTGERSYLGLSGRKTFALKDMGGTLLIVEVFSTYCVSCPKDVPVLNAVYSSIEGDPGLKGKVKVIGIAAGNNDIEAQGFKKEHGVLYPVLTDNRFAIHKALGNPRVPFTIWIKKSARDHVVDTHQGVLDSTDTVLQRVRNFLR